MTTLTAKQVQKKYKGKYVKILKTFNYEKGKYLYEVVRTYKDIHENTTLGEDVGIMLEYTR